MATLIIPWVGGKRRLAEQLILNFPPHTCYVEVFSSGAAPHLMCNRCAAGLYYLTALNRGTIF